MSPYGEPTDPIPYIVAAYAIGMFCIIGYAAWLQLSRKRVERYLSTFSRNP